MDEQAAREFFGRPKKIEPSTVPVGGKPSWFVPHPLDPSIARPNAGSYFLRIHNDGGQSADTLYEWLTADELVRGIVLDRAHRDRLVARARGRAQADGKILWLDIFGHTTKEG